MPGARHFLSPLLAARSSACTLVNARTGAVLATTLEPAVDSRSRRQGLLGRAFLSPTSALVLAPCNAVHTWFMKFPLDIVCVRRDGRVVKIARDVPPWRVVLSWSAFAVIEWRSGALAGCDIAPGDALRVERSSAFSAPEQITICPASDSQNVQ